MDLEAKLGQFRKKALWKQVQGYKQLLARRDAELDDCQRQRAEAVRTADAAGLVLSKVLNQDAQLASSLVPSLASVTKDEDVHDKLRSFMHSVQDLKLDESFSNALRQFLSAISHILRANADKVIFRTEEPAADLSRELQTVELQKTLEEKADRIAQLEAKIFSLEKKAAVLAASPTDACDAPAKRPRTELEAGAAVVSNETDRNTETTIKALNAELQETKRVSDGRLAELDAVARDCRELKEELERRKEQLRRIPQEFWNDIPNLRFLSDEIRRYRRDLDEAVSTIKLLEREAIDANHRHGKIVAQLEHDVREKYTRLEDFVRATDTEIGRLRKDRDSMRQMYEQSNNLLSSSQKQIATYQSDLASSGAAVKALTVTVATLKAQIAQIPAVVAGQGDQAAAIESLRADGQVYVEELESLGRAFEELQSANAALIKKIAEKDDGASKLLGDKLKAEFSVSQIQKEGESVLLRAQKMEELAKHRVSEMESREGLARQQLGPLERSLTERIVASDSYKSRLGEAASEIAILRGKVERLNEELAELRSQQPSGAAKDQAAYEKRRLLEELGVAKKRLEAYASSGVGLVQDLEEELVIYKKLMKCNSCHIRDKDAVILKCMHCFCKTCLDIRIETRQRKCPNCGDSFGAGDVRQIYL